MPDKLVAVEDITHHSERIGSHSWGVDLLPA
jgi:hypothetical protein